jgi:hypothetical protein
MKKIRTDEMVKACSTQGKEKCMQDFDENARRKYITRKT